MQFVNNGNNEVMIINEYSFERGINNYLSAWTGIFNEDPNLFKNQTLA